MSHVATITRRRILLAPPSMAGVFVAAFGFAAALTPSLLPRRLVFLLLLTGLGAIAGYAIGTTAWWALRKIPALRAWRVPRLVRFGLPALAWLIALAFVPVAVTWQAEQQSALDMPAALPSTVTLIVVSAVIMVVLLGLGRLARLATDRLAALLARIGPIRRWVSGHQPGKVHRSIAVVRLAVAIVLIVLGALGLRTGISMLISSYDSVNADQTGQSPTDLGINSGSEGSLAPWDTLGREGRFYVSNTMTPDDIAAITGRPADVPVRVYIGMQQGDTPDARTALAVQELDRVGAWDREYLVIFGVTGTGWVDPNAINALEAVTDGDVTTVAVQYSAVPSWIGFVIDPQTTIDQNRSMIDGVLAAWRAQPADQRPELILFGQSLGAMGTQGAWTGAATPVDVTAEIPHVIWMGPPAAAVLWSTWQDERTSGPAWDPVIGDGAITRVLVSPSDTSHELKAPPTIVFAAHANDPVVYWSPDLLLRKPDWLSPPLGPGVAPEMQWYPVITFLQVGMDLIGGGEPPEVGHNYSANMGPAIALAVNPDGWTDATTARLQEALPALRYQTG
ncbi:MAG: alpha/beta-hydrolase family protein [Actinomycetota bacterium]|nr:alpha/beta-hydrolase family protein [Actinomycetota bacterium]